MENPNAWNERTKLIWEAIKEHEDNATKGAIGFSLPAYIDYYLTVMERKTKAGLTE